MGRCAICLKKGFLLETNRCFSCGREICENCSGKPLFKVDFQNLLIEMYCCSEDCLNTFRKYLSNFELCKEMIPKLYKRKHGEYINQRELVNQQFNKLLKEYLAKKQPEFKHSGELTLSISSQAFNSIREDFFDNCRSSLAKDSELTLDGERIILEDSHFGSGRKVTLTDKRLIVQKNKGLLHPCWVIDEEIPLETIEEAYVDPGGFSGISSLWLKLNYGERILIPVSPSGSALIGSLGAADFITDNALKLKAVNDRWASAINNQINKHQTDQLSKHISECANCGKELPKGEFEFCPFCGSKLKS